MLNGRTELHIFDRGSETGDRYCEEVLLPHVRLFRGAIDPDFIFMDDNARPHRTLAVDELLESENITRLDWPAHSPDLNPIKHVWDALGRRIETRLHHPENTQQLKQMLIGEWALLPQEMLHHLVLSMRRRWEKKLHSTRAANSKLLTSGTEVATTLSKNYAAISRLHITAKDDKVLVPSPTEQGCKDFSYDELLLATSSMKKGNSAGCDVALSELIINLGFCWLGEIF
ncbi:transposable element Tcb2 transposase [Trichonephila clavipes]|nr:transposable element Tcb2 transposase [Trichonephila clavipes]